MALVRRGILISLLPNLPRDSDLPPAFSFRGMNFCFYLRCPCTCAPTPCLSWVLTSLLATVHLICCLTNFSLSTGLFPLSLVYPRKNPLPVTPRPPATALTCCSSQQLIEGVFQVLSSPLFFTFLPSAHYSGVPIPPPLTSRRPPCCPDP